MTKTILFAHERPGIARAVEAVLELHGLGVDVVRTGTEVEAALRRRRYSALVLDVAVTGAPAYELIGTAKELAQDPAQGAPIVVLVSSVYRKTSYKRRPARLYGADDYVEIHHLGDMLPAKLGRLLSLPAELDEQVRVDAEAEAAVALEAEGDARMQTYDVDALASLVVADVILYNGDGILGVGSADEARAAVEDDLGIARDLVEQVARARGGALPSGDPVGEAFCRLMGELGRGEGAR